MRAGYQNYLQEVKICQRLAFLKDTTLLLFSVRCISFITMGILFLCFQKEFQNIFFLMFLLLGIILFSDYAIVLCFDGFFWTSCGAKCFCSNSSEHHGSISSTKQCFEMSISQLEPGLLNSNWDILIWCHLNWNTLKGPSFNWVVFLWGWGLLLLFSLYSSLNYLTWALW